MALRGALAHGLSLPGLRSRQGLAARGKGFHLRMRGLRQANLRHGGSSDRLVLGRLSDGHPLQRNFGAAIAEAAWAGSYKSAWLLCAKLRRAMVAPSRALLAGIAEIDETEIPLRGKDDPITGGGGRSAQRKLPLQLQR